MHGYCVTPTLLLRLKRRFPDALDRVKRLYSITGNSSAMKAVNTVKAFKTFQTTSALCRAANVTRGQLRLYEKEGLIAITVASMSKLCSD